MKSLFSILKTLALAIVPLLLHTKLVAGAGGVMAVQLPDLHGVFDATSAGGLIATAVYWLELLVRLVPTAANYAPLTIVLSILESLAPNHAATPEGTPAVFVHQSFIKRLFHHAPAATLTPAGPAPLAPAAAPGEVAAALGYGATPAFA